MSHTPLPWTIQPNPPEEGLEPSCVILGADGCDIGEVKLEDADFILSTIAQLAQLREAAERALDEIEIVRSDPSFTIGSDEFHDGIDALSAALKEGE